MKFLVIFSCLLAISTAKPGIVAPLTYSYGPSISYIHAPLPYAHPITVPIVASAAAFDKSQYHAQNILGEASYGHSEPQQAHNAVQDAAGNKIGSYSYIDPSGEVITTNYIADALGYRVASNSLPVAPTNLPIGPAETAEVVAARAAHMKEHEMAKSRSKRSLTYIGTPLTYSAPLIQPLTYSTRPILNPTTYTTVINQPGHAIYTV